jgi:hypothetical protein
MAMPKGYRNAAKLKTNDLKQKAYKGYCEHIASGKPKEGYVFKCPTETVTWETIEKYMAEDPVNFPPLLMKEARAKRYMIWFEKGNALIEGKYRHGSPVVWQTIMRNMFRDIGWDKQEDKSTFSAEQESTLRSLFKEVADIQKKQ